MGRLPAPLAAAEMLADAIASEQGRRAWLHPVRLPPEGVEAVGDQRALALLLAEQGRELEENLQGRYEAIAVSPMRNRIATLGLLARAWLHLKPGGRLWFAAANDEGARGYEKQLKQLGLPSSSSKRHARLMRLQKENDAGDAIAWRWLEEAQPRWVEALGCFSMPGAFSWRRPDPGSALLVRELQRAGAVLEGEGADFGCGIGWLALQLRPAGRVHLVDADRAALRLAARNLNEAGIAYRVHWLDLQQERPPARFDWIVCNPPHHRAHGTAADVSLGIAFVRACAEALAPKGVAWIVANRRLPYEGALSSWRDVRLSVLCEEGGYKVLRIDRR